MVAVKGQLDLYRLAAAFRDAGRRDLGRKLDKGVRNAAKVIEKAVTARSSTDRHMPKGYERTFSGALKAKHEVRLLRGRRVTLTFFATGKKEMRDLEAMEQGRLRHPVFGRYRRLKDGGRMANPWVTQRIRPRVIEEPAMRAQAEAVRTLDKAVRELTAGLNNVT